MGPWSSGFGKPIRPYRRAKALDHRPIFISPRSGAAILAHAFGRFPPKPDGLVRQTSCGLNQNPSRPMPNHFVNTA
jgi:hypothetical protein